MSCLDQTMSNIDKNYRIGTAVHQVCSPDWSWNCPDASMFNGYLIWQVEGGAAVLESRQGQLTVQRGDFLLMPGGAGDFYHGRHDPANPLDVSWMHLHVTTRESRETVSGIWLEGIGFRQRLGDPVFAAKLMRRILPAPPREKVFWLTVLLKEVSNEVVKQNDAVSSPQQKMVEQLCEQIDGDPARYRQLSDLSHGYSCSRDHLVRLFKKHCGVTPGEYMIRARIDRAKQLLQIPGMSVKQVALDLGYPDPYAFSKQFKARTGIAPGRFQAH